MIESKIITIVDDHSITRKGIVEVLLENIKDIDIHEFNDEEGALNFIQQNITLNLIITDLQLSLDGKSFNIPYLANKLKIPFIVYSSFENKIFIEEAIRNNAMGYICKRSEALHLLNGVTMALNGIHYSCPIATASLERENLYWEPKKLKLSFAEEQILKLYVDGMNTDEVIKHLKISENTLRTHRRHILSKNLCNFEQALYCFNLWNGSKQNT